MSDTQRIGEDGRIVTSDKQPALSRWLECDLAEEARRGRLEPAFCREPLLAEGHHPRHGVRFLRQTVERLVTTEVARLLVARRPAAGSVLVVRDAGGRLAVEVAPPPAEDLPAAAAVEDPREEPAVAARR
jgi:hypothetical protein